MDPQWWARRAQTGPPGVPDPRVLRLFRRLLEPVVRLMHRPTLSGIENLPEGGPYLLVANHSGGFAASELLSFLALWLERRGPDRPLAGLAHPFAFFLWPFSFFVRGVGAIPSTYACAADALSRGVPVLVFPGGDHEATRPIWQANRVTFGGRKGFLRVARRAGVPIVPMGIRGSHYSVPTLFRSRLLPWLYVLPRIFGIKRMPVTVLGLLGAAAILALAGPSLGWAWAAGLTWAWLASPLPLLPWVPSTIRMRIGAPIATGELFENGAERSESDAELHAAYARVETAVQELVHLV